MNYKTLKSIYYTNKNLYEEERYNRINRNPATIMLPLTINKNPSFFVSVLEITNSIERIYRKQTDLLDSYQHLPSDAQRQYFNSCLIDEIKFTNDIEGVNSTRHEIMAAYQQVNKAGDRDKKIRFFGLVNKYNKLVTGEDIPLEKSSDIRKLYDEIILPEIKNEDKPDGEIFRTDTVSIVSGTQKVKHHGVLGEDNIIKSMDLALTVIKNDNIPILVRIAILHYYIGYIHPFYDGNGRLDRFISSYLLSKSFDPLFAYRLSYIIKNNREQYYKAFDECNDQKNAGDLTPFVIMFLDIIELSVDNIMEKVSTGIEQLRHYEDCLYKMNLSDYEENVLYLLVQNRLFSSDPFDASVLSQILQKSSLTVKRNLNDMAKNGLPVIISKPRNKYLYSIDLEAIDSKYSE